MKVYQLTWLTHCSSGKQTDFFKERDEYNLRKINYHIIQHVVNGLEVRMPLSKYKSQFVFKKILEQLINMDGTLQELIVHVFLCLRLLHIFKVFFQENRQYFTQEMTRLNGCQLFVPNRFLLLYLFSLTKEQHAFKLITTILYLRGDSVLCL